MELLAGLEPATCWLRISCSTNWATVAEKRQLIYYKRDFAFLQGLFSILSALWKIFLCVASVALAYAFVLCYNIRTSARSEAGYRSRFRFWRPGVRIPPGGPWKSTCNRKCFFQFNLPSAVISGFARWYSLRVCAGRIEQQYCAGGVISLLPRVQRTGLRLLYGAVLK